MSSLNVYLAAPYATRNSLRPLAAELDSIGMAVTSRWIDNDDDITPDHTGPAPSLPNKKVTQEAGWDLDGVRDADVLVAFTRISWEAMDPSVRCLTLHDFGLGHSGGRHVETGYAIALGRPVLVVGDPENIFHRSHCHTVRTWHEAILWLVAHQRSMPMLDTAPAEA